jgi:hypothetical protein
MTGAPFPRRPHLCLVPPAPPPRLRRIDVRLSVAMVESYVVRAQKLATMSEPWSRRFHCR